jgi:hypothetical protein
VNLKGFRPSPAVFVVAFCVLMAGAALLGASWWLRPVSEAELAMARGDKTAALDRYGVARQRFNQIPATKRLLPRIYDLVTANELSLLYSLQRYDEIIEKASADDGAGSGPFWLACALFDKALLEEKPEVRLGWISQSHQQFRRAIDLSDGDWDAKYNFELTGRLLTRLKKEPDTSRQEMMKILRDAPKPQQRTVRRVG